MAEKLIISWMELNSLNPILGNTQEIPTAECPLCFGEIEDGKKLSICGHEYCAECLRHSVISLIEEKQFPICCVVCGVALGIKDLKGNTTLPEFQKLVGHPLYF